MAPFQISKKVDTEKGIRKKIRSYNIGVWGSEGSGKTHYLAALWHEQRQTGWKIVPSTEPNKVRTTLDFIKEMEYDFYTKGSFLERTPPSQHPIEFRFLLEVPRLFPPTHRQLEIVCPVMASSQLGDFDDTAANSLQESAGLLVIMDPNDLKEETSKDIETFPFTQIIELLSRISDKEGKYRGRVTKYIAFCFSKIDRQGYWQYRHEPIRMAKEYLGKSTMQMIEAMVLKDHYKFFCFSVIGRTGASELNYFINSDRRFIVKETEKIKAFGIYHPIAWLIDKLITSKPRQSQKP